MPDESVGGRTSTLIRNDPECRKEFKQFAIWREVSHLCFKKARKCLTAANPKGSATHPCLIPPASSLPPQTIPSWVSKISIYRQTLRALFDRPTHFHGHFLEQPGWLCVPKCHLISLDSGGSVLLYHLLGLGASEHLLRGALSWSLAPTLSMAHTRLLWVLRTDSNSRSHESHSSPSRWNTTLMYFKLENLKFPSSMVNAMLTY